MVTFVSVPRLAAIAKLVTVRPIASPVTLLEILPYSARTVGVTVAQVVPGCPQNCQHGPGNACSMEHA